MARRVRHTVMSAAAVAMFVVLASATYQGVATALERRQFPHPGRLMPVGDHQLHILCEGRGTPTIVLEAPAAGMSSAWARVQAALSGVTRVCAYDRAGLGWSQAGDEPYDPGRVALELQALLERAEEHPPYLLVGQGLGAAFAILDAAQLSDQVAALVLIDAPSLDGAERPAVRTVRLVNAAPWLARAGILRATRTISGTVVGLPEPAAGALRAFLNRPDHLTRSAHELRRWNETVRLAAQTARPPTLPTVHLTVMPNDRIVFLSDEQDAAQVSTAVISLVEQVRRNSPAP